MSVQGPGTPQGTNGVHKHHHHHKKPEQGQDQNQGPNWNNNPPVPLN